jgi:putative phosphoribosyl transferase
LVRKIGVPAQPELAMGAVVDGGEAIIVRNEDVMQLAGISEAKPPRSQRRRART